MTDLQHLSRPDGETVAFKRVDGDGPTVVWIGGFRSDMEGTKAVALDGAARARRPIQRHGLGPLHVRAEAADPDDGRAVAVDALEGDRFAVGAGEVLKVGHGPLVPRPAVRVTLDPAARWRN